uniref:Reverse transcriptase domain-containing protein n=1 Tax=Glossina austeni TaxID=7395 RepID=A0A1A9UMC9_GLOAU
MERKYLSTISASDVILTAAISSTIKTYGKTLLHFNLNLRLTVFNHFNERGLNIKPNKCIFGVFNIDLLNYNIPKDGIRPFDDKVSAIKSFERPTSVKQPKKFVVSLGLLPVNKEDISIPPPKMAYGQNLCLTAKYSVQESTSDWQYFLSTIKEHFKNVLPSIQHQNDFDGVLYVARHLKTCQYVFVRKINKYRFPQLHEEHYEILEK